jgi:hypothetical protein
MEDLSGEEMLAILNEPIPSNPGPDSDLLLVQYIERLMRVGRRISRGLLDKSQFLQVHPALEFIVARPHEIRTLAARVRKANLEYEFFRGEPFALP